MPSLEIPKPGLGTWENDDPDVCANSVETALELGYRHVDTAEAYDNEASVARGLHAAAVDRDDYFLSGKVRAETLDREGVLSSVESSLETLGVDQFDIVYVHWPVFTYDPHETIPAFDELVDRELTRHIGVSNFTPSLLDEARDIAEHPIVAHQVEMHPLYQQPEMREYARRHDMWLVAYSPLARGNVFDVPELVDVADKLDTTPAQVSLAWLMGMDDVVPIPMADRESHLRENLAARGLELDDEDVEMIESIEREEKFVNPEFAPWK